MLQISLYRDQLQSSHHVENSAPNKPPCIFPFQWTFNLSLPQALDFLVMTVSSMLSTQTAISTSPDTLYCY